MTSTQLSNQEPYLIIHADGKITASEKMQPSETAARVLECMKTQFLGDAQATKIRELHDRIKRLEAGDAALNYSIGLDLQKENDALKSRIKRLEEAGDEMARWLSNSRNLGDDPFLSHKWRKAKEDKL